jgi:hypothetical protein
MARSANHKGTTFMAQGNQNPAPKAEWKQPVTFIPVATEKRGHFQRLPEIAWLKTVANEYGVDAANTALDAMRQFALRAAQARAKAKGVADSVEAEQEASAKALGELADGTYKARDTDPNNAIKSHPDFLAALKAHLVKLHPDKAASVTDAVVEATAVAHGDAFLERYGDDLVPSITYTPTKKSAAKGDTTAMAI